MGKTALKEVARLRRHKRVRRRIFGTPKRPRLCVSRTNNNIYAQVIDDAQARVLVSASTLDKEMKNKISSGGNIKAAQMVGKLVAQRTLSKKISEVVFDRGGYLYHGRVEGLAEAAREEGLKF